MSDEDVCLQVWPAGEDECTLTFFLPLLAHLARSSQLWLGEEAGKPGGLTLARWQGAKAGLSRGAASMSSGLPVLEWLQRPGANTVGKV